ncbi:DUF2243 domain-containing protein [Anabaena azotica]|uniref:DUF2243 domain-containing protein n=1 Tax=Anabaena azotica TaxID=197653 RepID=UPI0039A45209
MKVKNEERKRSTLLIAAGIFLGLGLGGFIDGILLHQILQWHHMISNIQPPTTISNIELNMVWDGLFHALDWIFTVIGVILLWEAGKQHDGAWSLQIFVGSILMGSGLFNVVEGLIDHQILGIHHVKPGTNQLAWDLGFLALGTLLVIIGWIMIQKVRIQESAVRSQNI